MAEVAYDLEARGEIDYTPTPTLLKFHDDNTRARFVRGPVGSGKSTATLVAELLIRASEQKPYHGVRSSKCVIIRNTYSQLVDTTLATMLDWMPIEVFDVNSDKPMRGRLAYKLPDGTRVECGLIFLALDRPKDVRKVDSLEVTFAIFNEMQYIPWIIVARVLGRLGRYPKKKRGGFTWTGAWGDTNSMSRRHWWYQKAEKQQPAKMNFYAQPPAVRKKADGSGWEMHPEAENIENLPEGAAYYLDNIPGLKESEVRVRMGNEYGNAMDGKPVYEDTWNEETHVAKAALAVVKTIPLLLGWDFGLTPACIAGQLMPTGQLRILREWIGRSAGIEAFSREQVKPTLLNEFRGMEIHSYGDPAGAQRSQVDEVTPLGKLKSEGIPTEESPTNDPKIRMDAVHLFLMRMVGKEAGFIIDPRCVMLIEGFGGGYRFKEIQQASAERERYTEQPEKNEYSHPHDALQYLCLGADPSIMAKRRPKKLPLPAGGGFEAFT